MYHLRNSICSRTGKCGFLRGLLEEEFRLSFQRSSGVPLKSLWEYGYWEVEGDGIPQGTRKKTAVMFTTLILCPIIPSCRCYSRWCKARFKEGSPRLPAFSKLWAFIFFLTHPPAPKPSSLQGISSRPVDQHPTGRDKGASRHCLTCLGLEPSFLAVKYSSQFFFSEVITTSFVFHAEREMAGLTILTASASSVVNSRSYFSQESCPPPSPPSSTPLCSHPFLPSLGPLFLSLFLPPSCLSSPPPQHYLTGLLLVICTVTLGRLGSRLLRCFLGTQ